MRRRFDGVHMGAVGGGLFRVVEPPWWRVDRWVRWLFARERGRLEITWMDQAVSLRVVRVAPPPNVPSEDAVFLTEEMQDPHAEDLAKMIDHYSVTRTRVRR